MEFTEEELRLLPGLFAKYMAHVGTCEGTYFLNASHGLRFTETESSLLDYISGFTWEFEQENVSDK